MKKIKSYVFLHILLFFFSLCSVFTKLASNYSFLSFHFCVYYGISLFILGIYAIFWQQILKIFPLTTAFFNKAILVVWGMLFGYFIFDEVITGNMIIGAIIVVFGIMIVVNEHER